MKNIALIGAVCAAGAALFIALSTMVSGNGVEVGIPSAQACDKTGPTECLPEVSYIDTEGTVWTHEALAGKVVMVNFWATWCRPCKAEIPALSATYEQYAGKGFVLLGVLTDEVSDASLASFSETYELHYPVVPVDGDIWWAFEAPEALPTTFIYDRSGTLRVHHRGPMSESQLEEALDALVAEPVPSS